MGTVWGASPSTVHLVIVGQNQTCDDVFDKAISRDIVNVLVVAGNGAKAAGMAF